MIWQANEFIIAKFVVMVIQFHSQILKKIPGLYHPFFKDFSRTFQDHTSFPGLSRAWKKQEKNSRTFKEFPGPVGTLDGAAV
jgi:hypothetical protein